MLAAPYTLPPKHGATVPMPPHREKCKRFAMKDFRINNALERIKSEGDIFKPVIGKSINLSKILEKHGISDGQLNG